jgi:hypothetical protein
MKLRNVTTFALIIFVLSILIGCANDGLMSPKKISDVEQTDQLLQLEEAAGSGSSFSRYAVGGGNFAPGQETPTDGTSEGTASSYPQSGSAVAEFSASRNEYNGVAITLANGSVFYMVGGALTPPDGTVFGEPVKIDFTAERDERNNELLFSFGPSGCQFTPAAEVKLSWKDLNVDIAPTLFYLEGKRKRIVQQPDQIDLKGKWMIIKIDHFSRYALAWSR